MSLDLQRIDKLDGRINQRGSELFFDEIAIKQGAELGVDNFLVLYGAGRAGVMGDVTAAQVCSAFAFFEPGLVHKMWSSMDPDVKPSAVAHVFATALAAAARERWDEAAAADVAAIGRKVADSVTAIGMPLFAGWRDMAVPGDPVGAATVTVMTLRELRGDIHVQSIAASGVGPLEADFFTRGEQGVQLHGWKPPYPEVAHHGEAMAAAHASTSQRMSRIYEAALDGSELDAFDEAVRHLRKR
jgi:hypothetical protein